MDTDKKRTPSARPESLIDCWTPTIRKLCPVCPQHLRPIHWGTAAETAAARTPGHGEGDDPVTHTPKGGGGAGMHWKGGTPPPQGAQPMPNPSPKSGEIFEQIGATNRGTTLSRFSVHWLATQLPTVPIPKHTFLLVVKNPTNQGAESGQIGEIGTQFGGGGGLYAQPLSP